MPRTKPEKLLAEFTKLVKFVNAKLAQCGEAIGELREALVNHHEEVGGHLGEFGAQLFGIHVIQEMILEKVEISPEEVKERIATREAALEAQNKRLQEQAEAAKSNADAEKMRQQMATPAVDTVPAGVSLETSIASADVHDHAG